MDPLILIVEEIGHVRRDLEQLEVELTDCEVRPGLCKDNLRYVRLVSEKELVLKNLCDIRTELLQKAVDMQGNAIYAVRDQEGIISYRLGMAPVGKDTARPGVPSASQTMTSITARQSGAGPFTVQSDCAPASVERPSITNQLRVVPVSPDSRNVCPLERVNLPDFLQAKEMLASIMRAFTENRVYFIGLDNHIVSIAEYHNITRFTKAGEDPAKFMKGESRTYKTGYNKKTHSYTENKLFIPAFKPCRVDSAPELISAVRASSSQSASIAPPLIDRADSQFSTSTGEPERTSSDSLAGRVFSFGERTWLPVTQAVARSCTSGQVPETTFTTLAGSMMDAGRANFVEAPMPKRARVEIGSDFV